MLRPLLLIVVAVALAIAWDDSSTRAQDSIDVTGDWNASFSGIVSGTCDVAMQQSGADVLVAVDCVPLGPGIFRGPIDLEARAFDIDGTVTGLPVNLSGTVAKDGESIEGQWAALGFSGDFDADRKDRMPSLVDATGRWNVSLTPRVGVSGVTDDCTLLLEQSVDELTGSVDCAENGSATLRGSIELLTGVLAVVSPEGERIHLFSGTFTDGALAGRWLGGATFQTADFTGTRKAGPAGDANCDAAVTSVDATLLLQVDAGLIAALPCADFADSNGDGAVNSVDGSIALQRSAGLLALIF